MNRTTKGALAAGAAGALLLGGVGTLAFWTDTEVITGTDIDSGHLQLVSPDCTGWLLDGGAAYVAQVLVPGDILTQVCEYTVTADGEHLTASFDATAPTDVTGDAPLVDEISFADTYKVNTVATAVAGQSASLADVTVVATQAHTP
jgi:alternate signal-mediated exported protein